MKFYVFWCVATAFYPETALPEFGSLYIVYSCSVFIHMGRIHLSLFFSGLNT